MKSLHWITIAFCFLTLFGVVRSQDDQTGTLHAGAASVDISPVTLPALRNGGFLQASSDRVDDPLHARCLVLRMQQKTIAIVIVDSCMFPRTLCDEIKRLATASTGIPENQILISATHTHSAPSAEAFCLGCGKDEAYVKYVPAKVAEAIELAHRRLRPAKIGWTVVDGSEFTNCRRWITRSDRMGNDPFGGRTVRAMMHPGYQNPNYVSPAGPIDPWLSILSVVSQKDDVPICILANLSMHYFGGGRGFSADYFGEVARAIEKRIDQTSGKKTSGFVGIMSQGTSGDLHWMDYSQPRKAISRSGYSAAVAEQVLQSWKSIEHRSNLPMEMAEKRLKIKRRVPSRGRLEWARPINRNRGNVPPRNQVEVYAQQAEWIHENPSAEVVLQAIRIGELGITAIPNEVYAITGLKLKRQSPLGTTFNLELANGGAGYIPPPEQHRLGGYTTWPARSAGLEENAEPRIVETLLELLESVSERKRRPLDLPDSAWSKAVSAQKPVSYWRLDDMDSTRVFDSTQKDHLQYAGGVALFLPGPTGSAFAQKEYGSRSVYLAGGHLEGSVPTLAKDYSISMWFWNGLPTDARDVTGTLLSTASGILAIAGKSSGDATGRLSFRAGTKQAFGKKLIATKAWHFLTVTKSNGKLRVYLDGVATPELEVTLPTQSDSPAIRIGSSGNTKTTFDGKVDELAIFDRELKPEVIRSLYKSSGMTPPPQPKPVVVLGPKLSKAESLKRYAEVVIASKPIAFWRLHDESAQKAADQTGHFPATYEQASAPYRPGSSIKNFSGGRVKTRVPKLGNIYSIEMWVRNELANDARPVTGYFFSRGESDAEGAPGDSLGIGGTHSNGGRLFVFNGNQRDELVVGRTLIKPGSWSHVVMVRQNQKVSVYLNGDPNPEISGTLPITYSKTSDDLFLGGRNDNFANLDGMLEEIALYDRALTPDEIKEHFVAGGAPVIPKPAKAKVAPVEQPTPLDVDQALKTIHVPPGFKVELIAAEPLVKDPVAIDWGGDGKLWVVEMADYPLGVDGKGRPGGRVRFLEDTNGDGQYDRSSLFADGLSFPNGVLAWKKGILVTAAPEIIYLEDSTGDGKADIRKVLFSGFLEGNQQLRVNGLRYGLDNWIYCASGSHHAGYGKGNQIRSHLTGVKHAVGSRDFRIQPDHGKLDPQSGPSQFGRNRDDWGNWFGVQNSHPLWHYVLADDQIRRNPHFAPPDPKRQVVTPANPRVYPASKLQKRFHSFNQSGRFTSACSAMIYRDRWLFGSGDVQHAFTCEPFHNLVQHNLIEDSGVSFKFRRDPGETKQDFFASEDRWCRPVMVRTGPDGALWVVDMYRYMIEHPQWLPKNGQDELRPWYRAGDDRGRIYRVVRTDEPARKIPRLADFPVNELVSVLESPNGWQRDWAQRRLIEQKNASTVNDLSELASHSGQPLARLHALWSLNGMGLLEKATLEAALSDSHSGVRRNAVRIAANLDVDPEKLSRLVNDPDPKVRLQLSTTLGNYDGKAAAKSLADLALASQDNPYILSGVMSSLNQRNVSLVLASIMESPEPQKQPLMLELVRQSVRMGNQTAVADVLDLVFNHEPSDSREWQFVSLATVLDGLPVEKPFPASVSPRHRELILQTIEQARSKAENDVAAVDLRVAAIQLLLRGPSIAKDLQLLGRLLVPLSPVAVQRAVVSRLSASTAPETGEILLAGWRSHSPQLKQEILNVLASRRPWAESLKKHLLSGTLLASELNAQTRQRFLGLGNGSAEWADALSVRGTANRSEVIREYQAALQLDGDEKRGAILFQKLCSNCHQWKDQGHAVGPNLATITTKTRESLLISILDPHAAVEAKYLNYLVATTSGQNYSGMLATETGSSITLMAAEGKRQTILRRDIEELKASKKSLMPDGLEKDLKPADLADLIEFVRSAFR